MSIEDNAKPELDRAGNPKRSSLAKKSVAQILGDGESLAVDKEIVNAPKKTRRPRKKNERPKTLSNMTLAQKKKFVELFDAGADFPAYNSYLGLPRFAVEWLVDNADKIKKEIVQEQKDKREAKARAKKEAEELNSIARKTGQLFKAVDKVATKGKPWSLPKNLEKVFKKEAVVRSVKWLANKYHPEGGLKANEDIKREIKRLVG